MKKKVSFKCILTTILVSFLCFGLVGVINNKPKNTLDNVSKCIKENIIIKQDLKIIYRGKAKDLKPTLVNKEVVEIATCDDTENTICIFIK